MRFEVKSEVARKQQKNQRDDDQIAPVPPGGDLARCGCCDQRKKACVDQHCEPPGARSREGYASPSCHPENDEGQQGLALNRQPASPVRDRGEQEAGDDGREIAVEHFMNMPVARCKGAGKPQFTVEHRQPHQDGYRRPDRAEEEEGTKACRQERPTLILAIAWDRHVRLLPPSSSSRRTST